jgi:hypothetical protein
MLNRKILWGVPASFVLLLFFYLYSITRPYPGDHAAQSLRARFEVNRDPAIRERLAGLLDERSLSPDVGNQVLKAIVAPEIHARENYLQGRKAIIALDHLNDVHFSRVTPVFSAEAFAGDEVIGGNKTNEPYLFSPGQIDCARAVRPGGKAELGSFAVRIVIKYQLLTEPRYRIEWPGAGSFPHNLKPVKVPLDPVDSLDRKPAYTCQFDVPISLKVASRADVKPVLLVSDPEMNQKIKNAFSLHSASGDPGHAHIPDLETQPDPVTLYQHDHSFRLRVNWGVSFEYNNLPMDVALNVKFRDENGKEQASDTMNLLARAGQSGTIYPGADLFKPLSPGEHRGHLILFTDDEMAYEIPGITQIWSGTLEFPITITVAPAAKPVTNR